MAITVELGIGQIITVQRDTATIGQDPGADIRIPNSPKIQPIHARIVKVANRWMIQSAGDWLLQVGDGVPGRKLWLNSGDLVHLSESGPYMVFDPKPIAPKPAVQLAETAESNKPPVPPFLQPVDRVPAKKPKKPQPSKQLDEDDEAWEEVFGYWMEDRQK
jgi:pSer/pThr/pTyr-binding forkhead associated (FHA) protein